MNPKPALLLVSCFLRPLMGISQMITGVFLFDLESTSDSIRLCNQINISDYEGYDYQTSFYGDTTLLFSST